MFERILKEFRNSPLKLSKFATQCPNTPETSVNVGRSFSMYWGILASKRCQLKEATVGAYSLINYNGNLSVENDNGESKFRSYILCE